MSLTKQIIDKTLATPRGERAYKIVETLADAGFDTWWVGGGVRDMALGIIPKDIDIGTSAKPKEICDLFKRSIDDAAALGSVRILLGNDTFEVTTFREDDEASDGRHPEAIVFGKRDEDVKRRDFTVNAIYFHPISLEVYDPFEGLADLKEKLIRFIGEPGIRIKHDALRMLRAVRFRALLDGQYHPETYQALRENAQLVEILSGSRQREELEKMLLGPRPARALEDLWELGILARFILELERCKGVAQPADYHHEGDVWDHTMQCLRSFRNEDGLDVRVAALFHDCGKAETFSRQERIRFDRHATVSGELTTKVLDRLQCPKKRKEKIDWLIRHHMSMTFLEMPEERKAHWYFHPWFSELLQVFFLDIAGTTPSDFSLYEKIVADYHSFLNAHPRPPKQLLTGEEIMNLLGIGPGEQVGKILKELQDAQVKGEVTTKKEAKEFIAKQKQS
jgi:poly(A) polymerase